MVAINKTPSNINFLSVIGYEFILFRAPNVNFYIQEVQLPGMSLPAMDVPNPFVTLPYPGEHINYEDLQIQFKLDESMLSYLEIHNWIRALGFPESFSEYKELNDKQKSQLRGEGIFSDISITLLTNLKNPNVEFVYKDCWPTSLSSFSLNTQSEEVAYLDMTATFKYGYFDINVLT